MAEMENHQNFIKINILPDHNCSLTPFLCSRLSLQHMPIVQLLIIKFAHNNYSLSFTTTYNYRPSFSIIITYYYCHTTHFEV